MHAASSLVPQETGGGKNERKQGSVQSARCLIDGKKKEHEAACGMHAVSLISPESE
jgi:hypothetical protein